MSPIRQWPTKLLDKMLLPQGKNAQNHATAPLPDAHIFLLRQPLLKISDWEERLKTNEAALHAMRLAEQGKAKAQVQFARILLLGLGVEKNEMEAFAWFGKAAAQNNIEAMNMLGRCFEHGWGIDQSFRQAAHYFSKAATLGDDWAMFNLADLYRRGDGVQKDEQRAFELYSQAALRGNPKSFNMLGLFYEEGEIIPQNIDIASNYFRQGAEKGDCWGCFNYARMLLANNQADQAFSWLETSLNYQNGDYCQTLVKLFGHHSNLQLRAIAKKAAGLIPNNQIEKNK
ncbi:sel1 repeat family protein [Bartonella sp. HY329]|uniref:tetratricopeptide repeat protein n=1 Tax=unclassified Bartonella TaxID=2645622 RepID=UPI0021C92EBF|nr:MULTISPECIES: tetratricopeptide repeat protein [unclassified Bartonella]UXM95453.1 sel1 repeat family protein [Bartonella sp. HY329]UXN09779.1 sel1 repeat family protein [Bartonella sp. HY328]